MTNKRKLHVQSATIFLVPKLCFDSSALQNKYLNEAQFKLPQKQQAATPEQSSHPIVWVFIFGRFSVAVSSDIEESSECIFKYLPLCRHDLWLLIIFYYISRPLFKSDNCEAANKIETKCLICLLAKLPHVGSRRPVPWSLGPKRSPQMDWLKINPSLKHLKIIGDNENSYLVDGFNHLEKY